MVNGPATTNLAGNKQYVKSNSQLPLIPDLASVAHHKVPIFPGKIIYYRKGKRCRLPYGLPSAQRILSPKLFNKMFDKVREFLEVTLGFSTAKRELILRCLVYLMYYGKLYAKASQICAQPGCSERTFWRTMNELEAAKLVEIYNRFICREHAQISNLYDFRKLLLLIARYLAEHGQQFAQKWLLPYLSCTGAQFWGGWVRGLRTRAGPLLIGDGGPDI